MKKIAVYAGSFDPVTNGHEDILTKAASTFELVYLAVGNNPRKKHMFSLDERVDMLNRLEVVQSNKDIIQVASFNESLAQFCREKMCSFIVRGLRNAADYGSEIELAAINKNLCPWVNTVFFIPDERNLHISSSMVKELWSVGESVKQFVSPYVMEKLRANNEKISVS